MNRVKHIFTVLLVLISMQVFGQAIPDRPNPPRLVNDKLKLLSDIQRETLEQKLVDFEKRSSNQIAIYTTDDMSGMDVGDYATQILRKWGVGGKENNNGVVLIVYRNKDNTARKVFITTGYGLEGVLPDYTCSEIVNAELIPNLKGGDYYAALNNGTDAIIKATEGKYTAPPGYGKKKGISWSTIMFIIFIVIIVISMIAGGGGGGSYMSRRGFSNWIGPSIWWAAVGGGGGGGGGGGDSGGFGGFGGGSGGGGGAGGNW